MAHVYVVDALRTPIGRYGGALSGVRPDDLLALTISQILKRNPWLEGSMVEDVIAGAANQAGEDNRNVARMAALLAGLPVTVGGNTVNRLCASGLQAIIDGCRAIADGEGDVILAGGVESMSRAPFVMGKATTAFQRPPEMFDTTLGWRFTNPKLSALYTPISMGETGENVAEQHNVSREDQDRWAMQSQQRYQAALAAGKFTDEIIAVETPGPAKGEMVTVTADEHPRATSLEKLANLKPAFRPGGTVTAGNSSGINDGAAMTILASEAIVMQHNLKPMGRYVASAVAGVDPLVMGTGPIPAIQKLLRRTGLTINDIDLVEINEAFASQVIASQRALGIDPEKLNVNGGAIALGHPLGMSGARLAGTVLRELKRRGGRYGIASMCIGVGQGLAALFEAER